MNFSKPPGFGSRFHFPENLETNFDDLQMRVTEKIIVQMVDNYETAVVGEIASAARAAGVTDCTLLNKKAILDALNKQRPQKQRIDNDDWRCCPRCNETFFLVNAFNKRNKYCGNCGQALEWGEEDGK